MPLRLVRAGPGERERRVGDAARAWSGSPSAPSTGRTSCRVASSSGSRSRGRWPTGRKLLLADEPTGQLDSETGHRIMLMLRSVVRPEASRRSWPPTIPHAGCRRRRDRIARRGPGLTGQLTRRTMSGPDCPLHRPETTMTDPSTTAVSPPRFALGDAQAAFDAACERAGDESWANRLFDRDTSLWSSDPAVQAAIAGRLGWLDAPEHFTDRSPAWRVSAMGSWPPGSARRSWPGWVAAA